MAELSPIDLKKKRTKGETRLSLTEGGAEIASVHLRFWKNVGLMLSLTLRPEAKRRRDRFDEFLIEEAIREATCRHCSRLIVYKDNPTPEECKLYERLGFKKSIYGFCQSFSYLY